MLGNAYLYKITTKALNPKYIRMMITHAHKISLQGNCISQRKYERHAKQQKPPFPQTKLFSETLSSCLALDRPQVSEMMVLCSEEIICSEKQRVLGSHFRTPRLKSPK